MIVSMTGYGDAQNSVDGVSYALEIRSLNNRYFKPVIRLPDNMQFLETEVEKALRTHLGRGSITCTLRTRSETAGTYQISRAAMQSYVDQVCGITLPNGVQPTVDLAAIAMMPGVCQSPETDEDTRERVWKIVGGLIDEAIGKLMAMRRAEGEALGQDLLSHCEGVREHLTVIGGRAPRVVEEYHQKLQQRVQSLLNAGTAQVDKDSLAREIAVFAERCDVSEEVSRLCSHLDQFTAMCRGKEYAGRKLDFLAQEMLRESNTIGSKSNDAEIARRVVEIKGLIDRLKEQVQNVE